MTQAPTDPRIYHITHVDNLPGIASSGSLLCDALMTGNSKVHVTIGHQQIKGRRLSQPVKCHSGLNVGDCVPFYFCPRSIMLYVIHRPPNGAIEYDGGQGHIVHLEADLRSVVNWANTNGRRWAFSLANASASYAEFKNDLNELDLLDWESITSTNFAASAQNSRGVSVKEGKQSEFLIEKDFPWTLVRRIGVLSQRVADLAQRSIVNSSHRPAVSIQPGWYF